MDSATIPEGGLPIAQMEDFTMRNSYMAGAALAVCLSLNPAEAGVITQATIGDNLVGSNYTIGYNYGPLGVGYHTSGGCPTVSGGATCSISASGTTDTSGTATASFDTASMTGSTPQDLVVPIPPYSVSAFASAAANLGDATVHASAGGPYLDYRFPNSGQNGGTGTSFAQAEDTLHFSVAGAGSSTVTFITVSFTVDGNITLPTPLGDSHGFLRSFVDFGGAHEETDVSAEVRTGYIPVLQPVAASGWVSSSLTGGPGLFTFTGQYALTGPTADLGIAETLSLTCGLGTNCDYSNTGILSLGLPGNVSYKSDSGVFLTQTTATPEPSTLVMIAGGLLLLPMLRRGPKKREQKVRY